MITHRIVGSAHLSTLDVPDAVRAPVLCLHGMFAGGWVYDALLPMIAERGHPASALSFRGHPPATGSASIGRCSIRDYCADATAAARELGRPIVIGHSLGGLVALLLTARNFARAAVLIAPAPPRGISVLSPVLLARMGRYLPAMALSRPFVPRDADLDALVLNAVPEAERAAVRSRFVPDSGRAARQAALGVFKVPARAVRAPVLVVAGDQDRFIPIGVSQRVAARYGAPLQVARGHGHMLLSEPGWQESAQAMLDWIDGLPRSIRDADTAG